MRGLSRIAWGALLAFPLLLLYLLLTPTLRHGSRAADKVRPRCTLQRCCGCMACHCCSGRGVIASIGTETAATLQLRMTLPAQPA